jgi:hypothetical protein
MHHGGWYVRYWETVRKEDGTLARRRRAHRLASVKDYPKKSEVIPLKNRFMESLNRIGFTPEAGILLVDFVDKTFLQACEKRLTGAGTKCYRDTWNCHLKPLRADSAFGMLVRYIFRPCWIRSGRSTAQGWHTEHTGP